MKTLYEYLINEKRADLSDWSDEDKIIIGRSFASDRVLGYSMLELGKSSGPVCSTSFWTTSNPNTRTTQRVITT